MSYLGKEPQFTQYPSKFFNGDGTAMTVSLDYAPPNAAALLVFIDGVRQDTSAYTLSGTSMTFTGTVPSGTNNVQVVHLGLTVDVGTPGDDTISTAKIQDDAVTADKLANSINSEIAANTAKVTNATHTGDVTGATALTIAPGAVDIAMLSATGTASATTFLRGDNAWVTPAAGGLRHITTVTNTSDASSIDIAGCFTSTYKNYRVVMNNVTPVSDTVHIYLNFGNSDLSTIEDGYQWILAMYSAGAASSYFYHENVASGSSGIRLATDMSNDLLYGVNMSFDVYNPYSSTTYTAFAGQGQTFNNSANWGNTFMFTGSTRSADTPASDESMKITAQSGNIDGNTLCSVTVFGYAES